jgi:DNA-binding MarR family transcriptional regulator
MRAYTSGQNRDLVGMEREVQERAGDLDIDFTAMATVATVFQVANAVRNHMEKDVLGEDGLSWTAYTALFVLWVWGDQESRHLAEECSVSKGTLTGVIGTLARRGLVTRGGRAGDGRLVVVSLTPAGRRVVRRLFPLFNEQESLLTARLSDLQRRQLANLLREMLRSVGPA